MYQDLIGKIFGKWTVISLASKTKRDERKWNCVCECGKCFIVSGSSLRSGESKQCKSCGSTKHGHSRTNETKTGVYRTWCLMKSRCYNSAHPKWKYYGGRGIKVCDRWLGEHGFENFLTDKGERPKGLTIDRYPDIDGDYTPENTRWATRKQQSQNRKCNKVTSEIVEEIRLKYAQGSYLQCDLVDEYGLDPSCINRIVHYKIWT